MEVGASRLPTAKSSRGTLVTDLAPPRFSLRGCHPLRRGIPAHFGYRGLALHRIRDPSTPHPHTVFPCGFGLGSPPFGRPYSGDPMLVSFPPPTKMFPFGGFPLGTPGETPVSRAPRALRPWQEAPFGDPGFNGCMRLPRAYRRLPRPSSAPEPSHPPGGVGAAGPRGRAGPGLWMGPIGGAHCGISVPLAPFTQEPLGSQVASARRGLSHTQRHPPRTLT